MDEGTRETFESPLEDVLTDLPQEDPPADLRDRCVTALREAHKAHQPTRQPLWPFVWKGALGLAAACVLIVGVSTVVIQSKRASSSFDGEMMADAPAESAEMMKQAAAPGPVSEPALERQLDGAATNEMMMMEAGTEAEEEGDAGGDAAAAPAGRGVGRRLEPRRDAPRPGGAADDVVDADAEDEEAPATAEAAKDEIQPTRANGDLVGGDLALVLAAKDVEAAQTQVRKLVEEYGGEIVARPPTDHAEPTVTLITARVPTDRVDDALVEMRRLGAKEPQKPAALTDGLQAKSRAAKADDASPPAPPTTPTPAGEKPPGEPARVPDYVTITLTITEAVDEE